jgi:hypothetical protein
MTGLSPAAATFYVPYNARYLVRISTHPHSPFVSTYALLSSIWLPSKLFTSIFGALSSCRLSAIEAEGGDEQLDESRKGGQQADHNDHGQQGRQGEEDLLVAIGTFVRVAGDVFPRSATLTFSTSPCAELRIDGVTNSRSVSLCGGGHGIEVSVSDE